MKSCPRLSIGIIYDNDGGGPKRLEEHYVRGALRLRVEARDLLLKGAKLPLLHPLPSSVTLLKADRPLLHPAFRQLRPLDYIPFYFATY